MDEQNPSGPVERDVGRDLATELRKARADMIGTADEAQYRTCHEAADELDRLRAERDALALLLGECADELETEIHCRLSGQRATLRLELPQRARAMLREIGLPHGLPPNAALCGHREGEMK